MSASRTTPGDVAGAAAQTVLGVAAHVAAAGCLPGGGSLAVAVPTALLAVLCVARLLPSWPLLRLAGGQLAVHGVLAVAAVCTAGHVHALSAVASGHTAADPSAGHAAQSAAHLVALLVLRVVLDRVVQHAEVAAGAVARLLRRGVRRAVLRLPAPVESPLPAPLPLPSRTVHRRTPRRGPPARRAPLLAPA